MQYFEIIIHYPMILMIFMVVNSLHRDYGVKEDVMVVLACDM